MAVLIELKAENFKRLKAVELKPGKKGIQVIAGRNSQGKSSILDAIIAALCGKSSIDQVPVRVGEDSAIIEAVIDTEPPLRITRKIQQDGKSTLTITQMGEFESKIARPQQTLDSLVGKVAFDPLAFTRLRPNEQVTMLKDLVGVDTTSIDKDIQIAIQNLQDTRSNYQYHAKQLAEMPQFPDAKPVDVSAELKALEEARLHNSQQDGITAAVDQLSTALQEEYEAAESLKLRLKETEEKIARIEYAIAEATGNSQKKIDTTQLEEKIKGSTAQNREFELHLQWVKAAEQLKQLEKAGKETNKQINELREKRLRTMMEAKWPVPGLGFNSSGVTYNDLPFTQCSSAEQLRISTAIGLSQNPTIRLMLIKDGSLLDDESLKMLHELAVQHQAQIILERVGTGQPGEIVIEDGSVLEA